jgi:hypothetical protein
LTETAAASGTLSGFLSAGIMLLPVLAIGTYPVTWTQSGNTNNMNVGVTIKYAAPSVVYQDELYDMTIFGRLFVET